MAKRPRFPCLLCQKKYCSKANAVCKKCEIASLISILNLDEERARIVKHHQDHNTYLQKHGKPSEYRHSYYKPFIVTKRISRKGYTWFERGDVSFGYPAITHGYGKKEDFVIEVSTYSPRFKDLGSYGKYLVGGCIIRPTGYIQWIEGPYEQLSQEQLRKVRAENKLERSRKLLIRVP